MFISWCHFYSAIGGRYNFSPGGSKVDIYGIFSFFYISVNNGCVQYDDGLFLINAVGAYESAPILNIGRWSTDHPYMTINTRSCIPAGVFAFIYNFNGYYVFLSCWLTVRCYVYSERGVSVDIIIRLLPIDPYFRLVINSFEV